MDDRALMIEISGNPLPSFRRMPLRRFRPARAHLNITLKLSGAANRPDLNGSLASTSEDIQGCNDIIDSVTLVHCEMTVCAN